MSDTEEQKVCQTCSDFEPQTWRKSLCKNCFHTLEEHSAEMLANEANAVAKEKTVAKTSGKEIEAASAQTGVKPCDKKVVDSSVPAETHVRSGDDTKQTEEKEFEAARAKPKYGAARCVGDPNSPWSWAKDLGSGYVKPAKPELQDTEKGAARSATVPSSSKTTSTKSSPPTTSKPSVKSVTSSTTVAASDTSLSSSSSSPSGTTTTSSVTADTAPASVSKAKSFASKFESKAAALSQSKSTSKPPDIRPGSANVAALTGKLTDTASVSKTKGKLTPEKVEEQQKLPKKSDIKTSEAVKATETPSKLQKSDSSEAKVEVGVQGNKSSKFSSDSSKDRPSEKISKLSASSQSKASPFGKDILKSAKDSVKRDNTPVEPVNKKPISPQAKQEETRKDIDKSCIVRSISEKSSDNKIRKNGSELATSPTTTEICQNKSTDVKKTADSNLSAFPDSKPAAGGTVNNSRQSAKITSSSVEGKTLENSETKDRIDATKDSGAEVSGGRSDQLETHVSTSDACVVEAKNFEEKGNFEDENRNDSYTAVSSTQANGGPPSTSSISDLLIPKNETASLIDSTSSLSPFQSDIAAANKSEEIQPVSGKDATTLQSPQEEARDLEVKNDNNEQSNSVTFSKSVSSSPPRPEFDNNVGPPDKQKTTVKDKDTFDAKDDIEKLHQLLNEKDESLSALNQQLSKMEEQIKTLENERDRLQEQSLQTQKDDMEKLLRELRDQLSKMEEQCSRLEKDNQALIDKLHIQEACVKQDQENRGKNSDNVVLEEDLEAAEQELEEVKEENKELQRHIMEMKNEMDEMYDHFREHDHDEFREIQKELDMTAKNCRILQFKLRKAERRNDQIEQDRIQYEEKLRRLQDQFDSQDAKDHIRLLEEELRMAKEVSVRLHDELDVVEDKRNKALEENKHLTELLEHTDKRQFRLEMEIDKLRDIVADLKQQLKEAKAGNNNNKDSTPDRKVLSSIYTRSID
ncbi:unnamed protein product [Candidula unifasciata]|uniref:Uncharacterized protein n=1 Tax=Candidula unifasciata TaxID=100452 RepID=A0A8S4A380_9EUPU|nr:unnamed protein product [Candidula unifasciata]